MQLVAIEAEQELPLRQALVGVTDGSPATPVPHDHRSSAVVALGNHPFEVPVLHRVILDVHRQALVVRIVGRTLGHGPGAEDPIHFEPKIEVKPTGGVFVHDEQVPATRGNGSARLRGGLETSLGPIG